ncbi:DUF3307 domain-containing protein [Chryseobacterium indologenes]|uniref:DUF3307 domain-containing protein n=1 Tax=Chryseobacterium indologenes TaxID=253 RepID=A0A0N0ZVL2_CHRID|nr:DUF3307 domain-containing protein [Chryseobacterium indologenes]KPE50957.1 hypothetical protein AOB46_12245 [Chryseobacterium indologenes]
MIFTQLILAHLSGDFILQPNSWVADKEYRKLKKFRLISVCSDFRQNGAYVIGLLLSFGMIDRNFNKII